MSNSSFYCKFLVIVLIFQYAASQECKVAKKEISARDSKEKELHNKLMCNYFKELIPVKMLNTTLNLTLEMIVLNIDDGHNMNLKNEIHLSLAISMGWTDEYLTWDPKDYEDIQELYVASSIIWIPPFSVLNSEITQMATFTKPCTVKSSGYVHCSDKFMYQAVCTRDFINWPFDRSNCSVTFGALVYDKDRLNMHLNHSKVIINRPLPSKDWHLVSADYLPNYHKSFYYPPTVEIVFVVEHKDGLHFLYLKFPFIGILVLVISSVFLDIVTFKRTLLTLTNIVHHFKYTQYIKFFIPGMTDNLPDAAVYFRDSYILSWILLMFDVFTRHLVKKTQAVPKWIDSFIRLMDSAVGRVIMFPGLKPATVYSKYSTMAEDDGKLSAEQIDTSANGVWIRFASILNRFFLISVLLSYVIMLSKFLIRNE